ncbi:MAG: PepSY domain-containing protein [Pseudoxanthomonas sp.]
MRITFRFLLTTCVLLALSSTAVGAWAQSGREEPPPPEPQPRQNMMPQRNPTSLSDSVRRAQRETGGQVLGAERVQFDGREINRVKVMDDRGRVRFMDDDPQRRGNAGDRGGRGPQREDAPPRARGDNPRRP